MIKTDLVTRCRQTFRNRNLLLWMLLVPVLMSGAGNIVIGAFDGESPVIVCIQDLDGDSRFAEKVVEELASEYEVVAVPGDEDLDVRMADISERRTGSSVFGIVIPDDFDHYVVSSFIAGTFDAGLHAGGLSYVISVMSGNGTDYRDGMPHVVLPPEGAGTDSDVGVMLEFITETGSLRSFFLPGLLVSVVMLVVCGLVVGEECLRRTSGLGLQLDRTRSPIRDRTVALVLWAAVASATVMAVAYAVSLPFGPVPLSWGIVPAFAVLSVLVASLGLFISELVTDPRSAAMATSAVLLPMLLLSGGLVPRGLFPDSMYALSLLDPMTYAVEAVRSALGGDAPLLTNCAGVIVFSVLFLLFWVMVRHRRSRWRSFFSRAS